MMLVVAAVLVAGCGGDDDADDGGSGASGDGGAAQQADDDGSGGDDGGGASDDGDALQPVSSDPDGDVADFPIPSPPGARDAAVVEIDGTQAAQVWYDASRYDEIVDAYEAWFLDNGLIATPVERLVDGQIVIGGEDESGSYLAIIVSADDQLLVQLTVE